MLWPKAAAACFAKASKENVPYAELCLAQLCETGTGVSKDGTAVHILYEKALKEFLEQDQQHPDTFTEYRIAKMLILLDSAFDGIGQSTYAKIAARWYQRSADSKNARAAFEFARMTERGPDAECNYRVFVLIDDTLL